MELWIMLGAVALFLFVTSIALALKTIRPTDRGLIERFGRYNRFRNPGLVWIIPFVERLTRVNITEMMVDAGGQEIITGDSLNTQVDAQVYFKVKSDEVNVKASAYSGRPWLDSHHADSRDSLRLGFVPFRPKCRAALRTGTLPAAKANEYGSRIIPWCLPAGRAPRVRWQPPRMTAILAVPTY